MRAARPGLPSHFDDFLFAPIGEDKKGMVLSVLSALARLDVDPWQEAAQLAGLPADAATDRLAALIAALPPGPALQQDPSTIAGRLIGLLSHPSFPAQPAPDVEARDGAPSDTRAAVHMIVLSAIFMVFVVGAQLVAGGRHASAPAANAHAPTAVTEAPKPPESFPGQ